MNPLLIKGLIASGGAAISMGGIWGMYELFKPRTIQERLEWSGFTFPSTGENEDLEVWKSLAKSNNDATENKFTDVTITNGSATDTEANNMRNKCKELMKKELSGSTDDEINKVKLRCTKPGSG